MSGDRQHGNRRGGSGRGQRPDRPGGRTRKDAGRQGSGRKGGARQGDDRRSSQRRDGAEAPRDGERRGRPPIKGRRRTFDVDSAPTERERDRLARDGDEERTETWVDEGPVRRAAGDAVRRGRSSDSGRSSGRNDKRRAERASKRAEGALDVDRDRMTAKLGAARAARTMQRLGEAADAFAQDRFEDARRLLKPLSETLPEESAIRELYGLTLYRLGRWKPASVELEEFARRSGSTEQHPVLADCQRALGRHDRVEELWDELGEASPDAALVAEGRIVYAGSLADQGRIPDAIGILESGALGRTGKLRIHHLRMRYALADLYDRAGEHQSARRHFEAVASADPDFFDVTDRLRQL